MKDFFTKFHTATQKVHLSAQEKADIRARLVAHVFNNEVKQVPVRSPFIHLLQFSRHIQIRYVSLVAVMILIFAGVSNAAESSLPGDSLYQVKTSVNENIRALFAFTPQSKAQLHVELAVRRLAEVQDLAASGKLEDGAKAEVEQKLDQHLADLKDSLLVLEQQNPSATTTVVATSTDDAVATTTLVVIDSATSTSADTASSTDADADTDIVATTSVIKLTTLSLIAPASSTTDTTNASTTSTKTSAATSTLASKIKDASDDLKAGGDKVDTENYSEAYALVQKATQTTEEIKSIINDMPTTAATTTATTTSAIATSSQIASVIDAASTTIATSSAKK